MKLQQIWSNDLSFPTKQCTHVTLYHGHQSKNMYQLVGHLLNASTWNEPARSYSCLAQRYLRSVQIGSVLNTVFLFNYLGSARPAVFSPSGSESPGWRGVYDNHMVYWLEESWPTVQVQSSELQTAVAVKNKTHNSLLTLHVFSCCTWTSSSDVLAVSGSKPKIMMSIMSMRVS